MLLTYIMTVPYLQATQSREPHKLETHARVNSVPFNTFQDNKLKLFRA